MGYLEAKDLVKRDKKLRRKAWRKGEFIYFSYDECLVMKTGSKRMYVPTKEDLHATDWEVL
ncbi:Thoeris anti-defense Tad2 family protein [Bacillus cereus group sp. Bce026]|uniref:Thoeris anti-defense Tad2 family protein n=1 Tax=Bacillus cereus group sp. Bce026 TaxID=3445242 RepID=UPI003F269D83